MVLKHSLISTLGGATAGAGLLVSALTAGSGSAFAATRSQAAPTWLSANAKAHTATLTLVAGYNQQASGFNFNGYAKGQLVVSIPTGYKVTVVFSNKAPLPHSVEFVPYSQRSAANGFKPAFSGAFSPNPEDGIGAGKTQKFTFVAKSAGTYALICAVPGHAAAGMWDVLKVIPKGSASISTKM